MPVNLNDHSNAVADLTGEIAVGCDLSADLVEILKSAALWHDAGKADPRMQLWLGATNELLAKSGQTSSQIRARLPASGYPAGQRHELLSAELARSVEATDLSLHLIAAHHGHARPLVPPQDATPLAVCVEFGGRVAHADAGQVGRGLEELFWRMQEIHGHWALALLTAILNAADRHVSAQAESP